MAIYLPEAKMVSHGAGRSAVTASAYLSCFRLYNGCDGIQHDYTKKQGLVRQEVSLPEYASQEAQEQEYSVEPDKALTEYAELKAQTGDFDPVELYKTQNAIRPVQEKAAEQQLEDTMHEKPSLLWLCCKCCSSA